MYIFPYYYLFFKDSTLRTVVCNLPQQDCGNVAQSDNKSKQLPAHADLDIAKHDLYSEVCDIVNLLHFKPESSKDKHTKK